VSVVEVLPRSVWITKFVLTDGIALNTATLDEDGNAFVEVPGRSVRMFVRACDVHRSFAAALARAEDLRDKRVASLRKQIAKLEAMRFHDVTAPDPLADPAAPSGGETGDDLR
jgi:hypothetical protein